MRHGPVWRILRYDGPCQLCCLFRSIIERRGAKYFYGQSFPDNDDDIRFFVRIDREFYAWISESIQDYGGNSPEALRVLRRLSLDVRNSKGTTLNGRRLRAWYPLAVYRNVVQACHPDEFASAGAYPPNTAAADQGINQPKMLFRGRKRPALVEPALLRRWMRICQADHDNTCDFEDNTWGNNSQ